jgi:hypothetical protein
VLPVALSVVSAFAPAQETGVGPQREVGVGIRVRVHAPDIRADHYVGRIDSLDATVLVLDTAGVRTRLGFDTGPVLVAEFRRVTIRRAAIAGIEVSGGRTVVAATLRGAFVGSLVGGVLWGLGNMPEVNPTGMDFVRGAPPGLLVGALLGGVVGWGLGGERWLPAILPR